MKPILRQSDAGFTIMELIVVVVILGVLAAISAPNLLAILSRQRLSDAQAEALTVIGEAQSKAKQQKRSWEACFQDDGTKVRWFVRPVRDGSNCSDNPGPWNDLIGSDAKTIQIDPASDLPNGYYNVAFQSNGWVQTTPRNPNGDVNKIIFKTRNQNGGSKRCVYVATILGAVRTANDKDCER